MGKKFNDLLEGWVEGLLLLDNEAYFFEDYPMAVGALGGPARKKKEKNKDGRGPARRTQFYRGSLGRSKGKNG